MSSAIIRWDRSIEATPLELSIASAFNRDWTPRAFKLAPSFLAPLGSPCGIPKHQFHHRSFAGLLQLKSPPHHNPGQGAGNAHQVEAVVFQKVDEGFAGPVIKMPQRVAIILYIFAAEHIEDAPKGFPGN